MEMKRIVTVTDAVDNRGNPTNGVRVGRALRRLGHDVVRVGGGTVSRATLAGADLILAFGTLVRAEAATPGIFSKVRTMKNDATPLALWYFDLCNPAMKHDPWKFPTMKRIAPTLDWLITTDASYPWELYARNYLHLMQGISPEDFAGPCAGPEPRRFDVIFTGGINRPFHDRKSALDTLRRSFSVDIYGRGSARRVYGQAFFDAYQRARVAFVPAPPKEAARDYWSNRIYLAAATGTPCVVGYAEGLEQHYEDGVEVWFFRSGKELIQGVRSLIDDPDYRLVMGQAARERTLTEHSYDKRCETLLGAIWASN